MDYKKLTLCCFIYCCCVAASAQKNLYTSIDKYNFQYGFSLKASVELGYKSSDPLPILRLSFDVGVASDFIASWLYPSANLEMQFYNGGFGSRKERKNLHVSNDLDIIAALTFTGGTHNRLIGYGKTDLLKRDIPLYYFADFVYPALQNPFDYSFSVGTNIIFTPINREKANQRIGFINGHFNRFQISYYNDGGTPITETYLGDRKDRNYTGGGIISYHGRPLSTLSLIELSYKKFTGYTKNAFEVSNNLYLNYMNYHTQEQRQYNKSLWSLNIGNPSKGWAVKLSSYNKVRWDVQHYIHWGLFNTYHMVPYKSFWSITGSYYYLCQNLGLQ